ncbi:MAG: aminotransferase class V-fold PLP-dependent enzyme [Pseudomonadota bacterium]
MTHPADDRERFDPLLRTEFPIDPELVYLNHAAVGALPARSRAAVEHFCVEACQRPTRNYGLWLKAEDRLRERLARLLGGVPAADIALTKNTSEAVSIVAAGFDWRPGDSIVLPTHEFPSNRMPWHALAARGVTVREVELPPDGDPGPLLAACDDSTRLVAASWIRYETGTRLDVAELGSGCREREVLCFIDAIQGLGAMPFPADCADFVAGGSHKWLLAPEGVGYLYMSAARRHALALQQYGWRMLEPPFDFDRDGRGLTGTGRRFEPGTMNVMGVVGMEASLELLEELTIPAVSEAVVVRARQAMDRVDASPHLERVTPLDAHAGIVAASLRDPNESADRVFRELNARGITIAVRGGYLRFSPHCHTRAEQIDHAFDALEEILS